MVARRNSSGCAFSAFAFRALLEITLISSTCSCIRSRLRRSSPRDEQIAPDYRRKGLAKNNRTAGISFRRAPPGGAEIHARGRRGSDTGRERRGRCNSPDALLSPFQVAFRLLRRFETLGKVGTNALESALGERLQFEQLALFGVELTGTVRSVKIRNS